MELRALIFDVDGTLAETEEAHRVAFNGAFADFGLDWHWDGALYRKLLAVTGGRERIRHFLAESRPAEAAAWADARIAEMHKHKTGLYHGLVSGGQVPLRPGVAALIAEARRAGLRLAIATTTSRGNVSALLESAAAPDAMDWFEAVGAGEDAPAKKPDPEVYFHVLGRLRLPPAACLAVEDSLNGLRAACAAGLPTVITRSAYVECDSYPGALAVLDDLQGVTLARLAEMHRRAQAPAAG